jgi:hypothetical protein
MNKKFKKITVFLLVFIIILSVSLNTFAWSSNEWNNVTSSSGIGTGHKSMILTFPTMFFTKGGGNETTNRENTAEAARLTDSESYNLAATKNTYNGSTNYSPYHAKSEYSMDSVISHAGFLYELAKKSLSGTYLNTTLSSYTTSKSYSAGGYSGTINTTTQKRIVSDLNSLMSGFTISSSYDQGYVILGVYLHLIEDIYAHRAKFTQDKVDSIPNISNFTGYTAATLKAKIGTNGIPMIRLKDYLPTTGNTYNTYTGLSNNGVYEDNPFYWSERFTAARTATGNQLGYMLYDGSFSFSNYSITLYDAAY